MHPNEDRSPGTEQPPEAWLRYLAGIPAKTDACPLEADLIEVGRRLAPPALCQAVREHAKDCDHCRTALRNYERLARPRAGAQTAPVTSFLLHFTEGRLHAIAVADRRVVLAASTRADLGGARVRTARPVVRRSQPGEEAPTTPPWKGDGLEVVRRVPALAAELTVQLYPTSGGGLACAVRLDCAAAAQVGVRMERDGDVLLAAQGSLDRLEASARLGGAENFMGHDHNLVVLSDGQVVDEVLFRFQP